MLIRRLRGWELPERLATPESLMLGRRAALGSVGALAFAGSAKAQFGGLFGGAARPEQPRHALEATRNPRYLPGREITAEKEAISYNNFYEFGMSKNVRGAAQALKTDAWTVEIAGLCDKPGTVGVDDLIKKFTLEERVYRHRCVETWAMTVPWLGFPLAKLLDLAGPKAEAKYVVFTTQADPKTMPGLGMRFYPWPYTEGLTIAEARNELAFIAVGMYGQTLPPQNGAPLRLALPWKYGFKSAKSIVKIAFSDKRPVSFWQGLQDSEYGFWANVNPKVPHPRWSQASETLLGSDERVPSKLFNGYEEFVGDLYKDLPGENLFM